MTRLNWVAIALGVMFVFWAGLQLSNQWQNYLQSTGESKTAMQQLKLLQAIEDENRQQLGQLSVADSQAKLKDYWATKNVVVQFPSSDSNADQGPLKVGRGSMQSSNRTLEPLIQFVLGNPLPGVPIRIDRIRCQPQSQVSAAGKASNREDLWKIDVSFLYLAIPSKTENKSSR